jgi:hypothetical protein
MVRRLFNPRLGWLLAGLLATHPSRADDKAVCLDAASRGQSLRDAHKLLEARDKFRICARPQCPGIVQQDCGGWLADVERSLPTVVVTAKDAAGADVVDVSVTADGQPLATRLEGQAVPINPGNHSLQFRLADGTQLERQVLVREGEKNQPVRVVFAPSAKPSSRTPAPSPTPEVVAPAGAQATSPGTEGPAPAHATKEEGAGSGPWKAWGWALGGLGAAGLVAGTAFGVIAAGDKSTHCQGTVCDPGSVSGIKNAALAADIGLIGGGVFLAGGAALLLLAPKAAPESTMGLTMGPAWMPSGAGGVLSGRW